MIKLPERAYFVETNFIRVFMGFFLNFSAGMPKARQDREIDKFRNGDCNVIVATSVLLEGIDIKKCNFAIDFGMPGNEITLMQARGRVRANGPHDDWQYVIIVPREQAMMKERDLLKEKLMKETVAKVKRKSKEDFEKQVGIFINRKISLKIKSPEYTVTSVQYNSWPSAFFRTKR